MNIKHPHWTHILFGIMWRIACLWFILPLFFIAACGHLLVWVFDPTYDHAAALKGYGFLRREAETRARELAAAFQQRRHQDDRNIFNA